MKNIKLLMLVMAVLPFFASCSDDDLNTEPCTVGFQNEEFVINEATSDYVNIPIDIKGYRNGPVQIKLEAAPVGEDGAVEGTHYKITDKTLNLNADTLSAGTLNVEVKVLDDKEINEDRQFTLTIVSAKGAEIKTQKITVTIEDNDGDTYLAFFGTWTLTALQPVYDSSGRPTGEYNTLTRDVIINGTTDKNDADYESILTATCPQMFDFGVKLDCTWRFRYSFNEDTKQGTLGFICGDLVASYEDAYQWTWATDDGYQITFDDITTTWSLNDGEVIPQTIKFSANQNLYLYQPGAGIWDNIFDITLTKK